MDKIFLIESTLSKDKFGIELEVIIVYSRQILSSVIRYVYLLKLKIFYFASYKEELLSLVE